VLVGWFREFTMSALEAACHVAWNGAKVYSCSQSLYFAIAPGKALGTSRAISAMIKDLTGARIHVIGKPSLEALRCAARQLGVRTKELTVVGVDPSLEVPMAHRGGAFALAVNTGVGTADSFAHLPKKQHPHLTVHDVGEPARLRPIASMLTRTSPAPGSPTSSDSNRRTSGPPNSLNFTTFVFISAYLPLRSFLALLVFMDFVPLHYRRGGFKTITDSSEEQAP
jgi:hypothetical protein